MFFSKSYTPLTFNDTQIHKEIICKFKEQETKLTNIILYGNNGTGKYTLSQLLLESIYGSIIYKRKYYNNLKNYVYSTVHYEMYLSKTYDKTELKTFLRDLCLTQNIATDSNNIILIKNAHYLDKDLTCFIKTLIEHETPITFILIFNTITSIPNSFKNMFYEIRIPRIKTDELKLFISTICTGENIDMSESQFDELIQMTDHNITKIMLNLQFFKKTNRFLTYSNKQIDDILELVYENKNENILKIREKLYTLTAKTFNKSFLINYALKKVLPKVTCDQKKMELISEVSKIDINLKHSYKDLIHVEYFFIVLMNYID
jgi:DNA polymerase III delta prime subunit